MVGLRPLDAEGVFKIHFPRILNEETLGETSTPTIAHVHDTIIAAWIIRHPIHNHNEPITRARLYQLSYIPQAEWSMHEEVKSVFYSFS
ncbi:hypothetical protein JHK85_022630 [Glycine max]|uniref:Uncharacterized protein n=2 Tax=Glycine subgen. Soja TaxID=1462606 RepID=A0A0R0IWE3_SOYBN|nr:hypothetical protein JHK87_022075 [Glycine soja]KAG5016494.1 hypothetical protein JHK85_022630 [Glycine max]KAH1052643.1 hypothetical protein GYH30_022116 [Glycine max]